MMSEAISYHHVPVLLEQSIDALITDTDGVYVDVTFGGGGHSKKILNKISASGKLLAFDKDRTVLQNKIDDPRFELIISDFRYLKKYLDYYKQYKVHGILADLGVSSHHFDENSRGFSIHSELALDMRMNKIQSLDARSVVLHYSEAELERIFREFGELTNAKKLSSALIKTRTKHSFATCKALADWALPYAYGKKQKYLAQMFQALRIEVNGEMSGLEEFLRQSVQCLLPGGRLVVLSYHSLEDRMVKHWIKSGRIQDDEEQNPQREFTSLYKNAVVPEDSELKANSRSRSVKMRVGIKL